MNSSNFAHKDSRNPDLVKDPFWYNDWHILFNPNRLIEFIPTPDMTLNEKLNAIMRLSLYFAIVMIVMRQNYLSLYVPILTAIATYYMYQNGNSGNGNGSETSPNASEAMSLDNRELMNDLQFCVKPTQNNPFMNFNQITDSRERAPACPSYDNPVIQTEIEDKFNSDLYRDVSDIWGKRNSQRQFYTVPSTQALGDQTAFAKWLYGTDSTCKEDTIKCAPYDNLGQGYREFLT